MEFTPTSPTFNVINHLAVTFPAAYNFDDDHLVDHYHCMVAPFRTADQAHTVGTGIDLRKSRRQRLVVFDSGSPPLCHRWCGGADSRASSGKP